MKIDRTTHSLFTKEATNKKGIVPKILNPKALEKISSTFSKTHQLQGHDSCGEYDSCGAPDICTCEKYSDYYE